MPPYLRLKWRIFTRSSKLFMRSRTKAREIALCLLYQVEITKVEPRQTIQAYFELSPHKQEIVDFCSQLVLGTLERQAIIDELITKHIENWDIKRLAVIDRNILRMACFELMYLGDIPPKVSINEAIELAKRFGDIDSPRFVNGIVDKIYKIESVKKNG